MVIVDYNPLTYYAVHQLISKMVGILMPIAKFEFKFANLDHISLKFGSVKSPWKVREKSVKRQWKTREHHQKTGSPQNLFFGQKNDLKKSLKTDLCRIILAHSGIMEAIRKAKEREAKARQATSQAAKTNNPPVPQFRPNSFIPDAYSHFSSGLLAMTVALLRLQALALWDFHRDLAIRPQLLIIMLHN